MLASLRTCILAASYLRGGVEGSRGREDVMIRGVGEGGKRSAVLGRVCC